MVGAIWQSGGMADLAGPDMEQDPASLVPAPVPSLFHLLCLFSVADTSFLRLQAVLRQSPCLKGPTPFAVPVQIYPPLQIQS